MLKGDLISQKGGGRPTFRSKPHRQPLPFQCEIFLEKQNRTWYTSSRRKKALSNYIKLWIKLMQRVKAQKNSDPLMWHACAGSKHRQMPLTDEVEAPKECILSGESPSSAVIALKRTIICCAERRAVDLYCTGGLESSPLLAYLNQLSSFCFALGLLENHHAGLSTGMAKGK